MLLVFRPENPALHLHIAVPSGEFEFAGQLMQLASPLSALNEFATHFVQAPPSWPDEPTLQEQSTTSSLASGALEFGGHCWHTSEVAPTSVEY